MVAVIPDMNLATSASRDGYAFKYHIGEITTTGVTINYTNISSKNTYPYARILVVGELVD